MPLYINPMPTYASYSLPPMWQIKRTLIIIFSYLKMPRYARFLLGFIAFSGIYTSLFFYYTFWHKVAYHCTLFPCVVVKT